MLLSSLSGVAALVFAEEEQHSDCKEWQLMEEFINSCSSVIPHEAELCSFSGLCGCAAGLGLSLLKTCLHSLCYVVVV